MICEINICYLFLQRFQFSIRDSQIIYSAPEPAAFGGAASYKHRLGNIAFLIVMDKYVYLYNKYGS